MPPLILSAIVLVVFLVMWLTRRRRFLPLLLKALHVRIVIFVAVVGGMIALQGQVAAEFEKVGSGVAFTPISGVATQGPFGYVRSARFHRCYCFVKAS
jgi:hypothetical protein